MAQLGFKFPFPEVSRQAKKSSNNVANFIFPSDLGSHYTSLVFYEYDYRHTRNNDRKSGDQAKKNIQGSIALPIPNQLLDASNIRVNPTELGQLGNMAALGVSEMQKVIDAFKSASSVAEFKNKVAGGEEKFSNLLDSFGDTVVASLIRQALQTFAPSLQTGLEAGSGYTFNPYQALAFTGVDLKTYVFDWLLTPTTREETKELERIVKSIRGYIHPQYTSTSKVFGGDGTVGRAFLKYPSMVDVKIEGTQPGQITQFKPAMVSQFQVDYSASGDGLVFLEGGAPAAVRISMTIIETEIWTKDDYGSSIQDDTPAVFRNPPANFDPFVE